jgi:hypothetical protein
MAPPAGAQSGGVDAMALEAESAHVGEIAFAAAFGDGYDVVGIPEGLAAFEAPGGDGLETGGAFETADVGVFGDAICSTQRADAFIAFEDARAQMAWIRAETPFLDTEVGTEGMAAGGHFEAAPTTKAAAIGTFGKVLLGGPAAGHGAFVAHTNRIELNGQG